MRVRVESKSTESQTEMVYLLQTTSQGHSRRQIKLPPASERVLQNLYTHPLILWKPLRKQIYHTIRSCTRTKSSYIVQYWYAAMLFLWASVISVPSVQIGSGFSPTPSQGWTLNPECRHRAWKVLKHTAFNLMAPALPHPSVNSNIPHLYLH